MNPNRRDKDCFCYYCAKTFSHDGEICPHFCSLECDEASAAEAEYENYIENAR